jgi:hypothetical protein
MATVTIPFQPQQAVDRHFAAIVAMCQQKPRDVKCWYLITVTATAKATSVLSHLQWPWQQKLRNDHGDSPPVRSEKCQQGKLARYRFPRAVWQWLCALASRYSNVTFVTRIDFSLRGKQVHNIPRTRMPTCCTQSASILSNFQQRKAALLLN